MLLEKTVHPKNFQELIVFYEKQNRSKKVNSLYFHTLSGINFAIRQIFNGKILKISIAFASGDLIIAL